MSDANFRLGPGTQAFAHGVIAADEIKAQVDELLPGAPYDRRAALFWLKVGQASAAYTDQDMFDSFVAGVITRQPERMGVLLELDTSGPTFNRHEVTKAFTRAINEIADGADEGKLYDMQGRVIGRFSIDHS